MKLLLFQFHDLCSPAHQLYDKITKAQPKLRVFWDAKSLVLGEAWGQGFAHAITHSRMVVLVMSRGTFNCKHGGDCEKCPENIARLKDNPQFEDNVLLEYDLALELFDAGRVKKIVPILVGDIVEHGSQEMYRDFFDKFTPAISWKTVPNVLAVKNQKRAKHMLSKDPELKLKLDSSKKFLQNSRLREEIPTLKEGRTVHQTMTAGGVLLFLFCFHSSDLRAAKSD